MHSYRNQRGEALGLLALIAFLIVCACAGTKARENILEPAMREAWVSVSAEVERGVVDARTTGLIDDAGLAQLRSQARAIGVALEDQNATRSQVQVALAPWALILKPYAERGIAAEVTAGTIGPGVAGSKRERLAQFSAAVDEYMKR